MSVTLAAIPGWGAEIGSVVASAATTLESAAPTGAFASVLAQVSATLEAGPGATASPAAAATASPSTGASSTGAPGTGLPGTGLPGTGLPGTGLPTSPGSAMFAMPTFLPAPSTTGSGALPGTAGVTGSAVVGEAERFLGTPYVWGGSSPGGFDCSGLVQYVYRQLGISLPRTSEEQARVGTPVPSLAAARPGDLVFFPGSDGTAAAPGHVGIYLGNGMMIDAPYTGTDVQVQPVGSAGSPVAIRRIVATAAPAGGRVPAALAPLFTQAADKYGVPAALLTAVARHESGFNPTAVSTAGAEGMMQIMPGTAAGLGVTPFTPAQAVDGAARILAGDLGRFRSVPLALAAYNAGAGAVEAYGGVPPYAQTQAYVQDIMRTLEAS